MAHKVKNNHYVATHRSGVDSPSSGGYHHRASSREENDSHRAPSERTLSEYTTMDERTRSPSGEHRNGRRHQHTNGSPRADSGSDVILGIVFLIFGFITLLGSLIYCVVLCRENPYPRYPDDFYWTHHWSKTIGPSEIHYSASEKQYVKNGHGDRYNNKYNGKYSDRESAKGYSDRESKLSRY
ncbi:hypothetical protein HF086_000969 [Spodoptera exigua]|uniref:Uncharacterized protein n=1 Tax=Spodoptera exigua TaxID=7107 RepID=A0A922SIS1_SPOEX|nr:hypothetical protein HF086_000969 [Spodoptera exigua]